MKDVVHHIQYIQKKVVHDAKREDTNEDIHAKTGVRRYNRPKTIRNKRKESR